MVAIIKHQIQQLFKDVRVTAMLLAVLLLFTVNAVIYSNLYQEQVEDWEGILQKNNQVIADSAENLQALSNQIQEVQRKPSSLSFIAESGQQRLPNTAQMNAFLLQSFETTTRANQRLWTLPSLDWSFIIGTLLSLAALFFSFDAINGEKRDGTLKFVLANSISRLNLFVGKYLGVFIVMTIVLLFGILLNLVLILLLGQIPLFGTGLENILWAVLLGIIFLGWAVAGGMVLSVLTQRPSVALVLGLIAWIVLVLVIPGGARMTADQLVTLRGTEEAQQELYQQLEEVNDSQPAAAFTYPSDPLNQPDIVQARKQWADGTISILNRFIRQRTAQKIEQFQAVNQLSALSPVSLFANALSRQSDTGVYGFSRFVDAVWRYRQTLYSFVEAADATDPESTHAIYSFGTFPDRNVYSTKEIEADTVPRFAETAAANSQTTAPLLELLTLAGLLLLFFAIAFIGFIRFDPR